MEGLNQLYHGVEVDVGGRSQLVRAMVTQYRGDWKWHRVSRQHFKNLKNKVKMNYPAFSTLNVIILLRNGFCLQHGGGPPAFVMLAS